MGKETGGGAFSLCVCRPDSFKCGSNPVTPYQGVLQCYQKHRGGDVKTQNNTVLSSWNLSCFGGSFNDGKVVLRLLFLLPRTPQGPSPPIQKPFLSHLKLQRHDFACIVTADSCCVNLMNKLLKRVSLPHPVPPPLCFALE